MAISFMCPESGARPGGPNGPFVGPIPSLSREPARYTSRAAIEIPDHPGEVVFGTARNLDRLSSGDQNGGGVVGGAEGQILPHLIDDQQVTALAGHLRLPVGQDVVRLGGEPRDHRG